MILEFSPVPKIIRVTSEFLLKHQPDRWSFPSCMYSKKKSRELEPEFLAYMTEPRSTSAIREHLHCSMCTVNYLLKKNKAKCIQRGFSKSPGIWKLT